jgi:hypothetical protein
MQTCPIVHSIYNALQYIGAILTILKQCVSAAVNRKNPRNAILVQCVHISLPTSATGNIPPIKSNKQYAANTW